jgi:hypothetical protein
MDQISLNSHKLKILTAPQWKLGPTFHIHSALIRIYSLHIQMNLIKTRIDQPQYHILVLPFAIHIPLACLQPGQSASEKRKSAGPGPKIPFRSLILPRERGGTVCPLFSSSLHTVPCHSLYNINRSQAKQINKLLEK